MFYTVEKFSWLFIWIYQSCNQNMLIVNKQKQPPEVFFKKCILKNFAKFTGKHLCQSLSFNKVAGLDLQLEKKGDLGTVFFQWILRNF